MKRVILTLCLVLCGITASFAQLSEVKLNVAAATVATFNPSIEVGVGERTSVSLDYFGAFAEESFLGTGYPLMFSMGVLEYRYYTKPQRHSGFFTGVNLGVDSFRMNKDVLPFVANDSPTGRYDVGYGYLIGFTFGYKHRLDEHWSVEASITGGWHNAQHEGYDANGVRTFEFNTTAEWTAYKGGIYITYRL